MVYKNMIKEDSIITEAYLVESVEDQIKSTGSKEGLMKKFKISNSDLGICKRFLSKNPGLQSKFKGCRSIKDFMNVMKSKEYKEALKKE